MSHPSRPQVNIPRKRKGNCSQHDKGLAKFYESVLQAVLRHINFEIVKCILIASPGFVKDQFVEYLWTEAVRAEYKGEEGSSIHCVAVMYL